MSAKKKTVLDLRKYRDLRAQTLADRAPQLRGMHGEQLVSADVLPFPLKRRHKRRPRGMRDALALKPLLGSRLRDANVTGHLRDGVPAIENFRDAFHNEAQCAGDGLSRQAVATVPVTVARTHGTICRMGRAKTPVQFNKELALRLKSARIAAQFDTMKPFAKALGIDLERYKKWESGRTPFQHEYLVAICELTGKDANYFYGIQSVQQPAQLPAKRVG